MPFMYVWLRIVVGIFAFYLLQDPTATKYTNPRSRFFHILLLPNYAVITGTRYERNSYPKFNIEL